MALDSYANIKTALANWLADDGLTNYLGDFIALAEERIYGELRTREMETSLSDTMSAGVISVPSGFVGLKHARITGNPTYPLEITNADILYARYPKRQSDSKPYVIAVDGSNFIFGPYPDQDYTINGTYYKQLDALSDSNTTNFLTSKYPSLLLFGALVESAPFLEEDQRIVVWESKFQDALNRARVRANHERLGFGAKRSMAR